MAAPLAELTHSLALTYTVVQYGTVCEAGSGTGRGEE